jgi:hypothetical protein
MKLPNSSPLDIKTWIQLNKSAWVFTMLTGELNE